MSETPVLSYVIKDLLDLNLSYMPFIKDGGLFVPTQDAYFLGDIISVDLQLPTKEQALRIEGKVVWLTPKNALHHVIAGVGIQFIGPDAAVMRKELEGLLDKSVDVGGYTYGITEVTHGSKI
jgi:type IV pilus assembly protein PilZ